MTDDIRALLDRAASTSPPCAFDTDPVVAQGRARSRRRILGGAGGGAIAVAAVTTAILALTSTLGPGAAGPDPAPPVDPGPATDYTLPDLDPASTYTWGSRGRVSDAIGTQLTGVLANWFATNLPAVKAIRYGPGFQTDGVTYEIRTLALDAPESPFLVSRYTNRLAARVSAVDGAAKAQTDRTPPVVVHEEPIYRLGNSAVPAPEQDAEATFHFLSGLELAVDGVGQQQLDLLRFVLLPSGGYRAGFDPTRDSPEPVNGYLAQGCATYEVLDAHPGTEDDRRFSFDCSDVTAADGQRILRAAQHETYLEANLTFTRHTVVVYRTDGTAVVLSDTPRPGLNFTQGSGTVPTTPGLSLDALVNLALAIPLVPIG